MRKRLKANRAPTIVLGVLALVVAAGGGAIAASGGGGKTITACVKKQGGTLYQAKKCKKHDKKLTWNKQGPPGPAGTNGTNGTNGAVAGFSATKPTNVDFTGEAKQILTRSLPAGSFIVQAKTQVGGAATSTGYVNDKCTLADGSASDLAQFSAPLAAELFFRVAETSLPMQIAVSSSSPSTVTLSCEDVAHEGTAFSTGASNSVITAVQTNGNS